MTGNDFFQELGREWQQEKLTTLPDLSVDDALRSQRRHRLLFRIHILFGALGLMMALYFLWLPMSPVTIGASLTLVATVLVDLWFMRTQRRNLEHWSDWSPEGLLVYRKRLLLAELRTLRYYLLSALALLVFTGFVWSYAWLTPAFATTGFHHVFAACSVPISAFILVYFSNLLRRRREHFRTINELMADFADNSDV
jgi:hypothetical protein